ncbi:hypothetical protein GVAMD_0696 [Gardnerella vaginalis AMD]|nr:hypothetical protein GVAMD_0696 [Gardnerella vaginalis AMD]
MLAIAFNYVIYALSLLNRMLVVKLNVSALTRVETRGGVSIHSW